MKTSRGHLESSCSVRRVYLSLLIIIVASFASSTEVDNREDAGGNDSNNNDFYAERVDTTVQCSLDHTAIVTLYLEDGENLAVLPGDRGYIRPTSPPGGGDIAGSEGLDFSQLFGNDDTETQSPSNETVVTSPSNFSDSNSRDFFNGSSVSRGQGVEHRFRECWCAPFVLPTSYYRRQAFYCLEEFDTCQVHGRSGTIACFSSPKRTTFVRGFWPVCLFWYGALLYIFFASEQGQLARQFMKRGLCSCVYRSFGWGGQGRQDQDEDRNRPSNDPEIPAQEPVVNNDNEDRTEDVVNGSPRPEQTEVATTNASVGRNSDNNNNANAMDAVNQRMLEYELDRMRQDHPSRLSWLLQSAMARERNERWRLIRQLQLEQHRQLRREAQAMRQQQRQQDQQAEPQNAQQEGQTSMAMSSAPPGSSDVDDMNRIQNESNDEDGSGSGSSSSSSSSSTSSDSEGQRDRVLFRIRRLGPFPMGGGGTGGTSTEGSAISLSSPGLFSPSLALAAFTSPRLQPTLSLKTKVFKGRSTINAGQEESDEEDDLDEYDDDDDNVLFGDDEESNRASASKESGNAHEKPRKKRFARCAICLVRVEIGDVVGDIACGHIFHKACM